VVKAKSKRAYHKQDMDNLNRTALIISGVAAAVIIIIMIIGFI
jgi:hypothetical protein